MTKIKIDNGGWFDTAKATSFAENTRWNGQNHISCATGSQWDHERLYCTPNGNWVLNWFSQWQGSVEKHNQISQEEAIAWLMSQELFNDPNIQELPKEIQEAILEGIAAQEV